MTITAARPISSHTAPRLASYARGRMANADAFIERIAAGMMLLAVIATFTLSSSVLTNWKIHYLTAGGNFYEKLHPATYFTLLAFALLLMRSRGPVGEINRMFSESKLLLAYLLCWLFLLIQVIVLERPFTVIIDTFLLPILIAMVMWQLPSVQRRRLVWAIHLAILLNVAGDGAGDDRAGRRIRGDSPDAGQANAASRGNSRDLRAVCRRRRRLRRA